VRLIAPGGYPSTGQSEGAQLFRNSSSSLAILNANRRASSRWSASTDISARRRARPLAAYILRSRPTSLHRLAATLVLTQKAFLYLYVDAV
jgi:hypothetical protein